METTTLLVVLTGVILLILGRIGEGVATAASSVVVYFIQQTFHTKESQFRQLAERKSEQLEYGNQWLLVMQSISTLDDRRERNERLAALVDTLHTHLAKARSAYDDPPEPQ